VAIETLFAGDHLSGREAMGFLAQIVGENELVSMLRWRDFGKVKFIGLIRGGGAEHLINPDPRRLRMQWGTGNPCQDDGTTDLWARGKVNSVVPVVVGDHTLQVTSEFTKVGGSVGADNGTKRSQASMAPAWAGRQDARQMAPAHKAPQDAVARAPASTVGAGRVRGEGFGTEVDDTATRGDALELRMVGLVEGRSAALHGRIEEVFARLVATDAQRAAVQGRDEARWREIEHMFSERARLDDVAKTEAAAVKAMNDEVWRRTNMNSDTLTQLQASVAGIAGMLSHLARFAGPASGGDQPGGQ